MRRLLADWLNHKGNKAAGSGNRNRAVHLFESSAEAAPTHGTPFSILGPLPVFESIRSGPREASCLLDAQRVPTHRIMVSPSFRANHADLATDRNTLARIDAVCSFAQPFFAARSSISSAPAVSPASNRAFASSL